MNELKKPAVLQLRHNNSEGFVYAYEKEEMDKFLSEVDIVIATLRGVNEAKTRQVDELKAKMPEYEQFIKDEEFRKKLVDEYKGYVYHWKGHDYIATPYINIFIKGLMDEIEELKKKLTEAK